MKNKNYYYVSLLLVHVRIICRIVHDDLIFQEQGKRFFIKFNFSIVIWIFTLLEKYRKMLYETDIIPQENIELFEH